jgi:hypothetical protein
VLAGAVHALLYMQPLSSSFLERVARALRGTRRNCAAEQGSRNCAQAGRRAAPAATAPRHARDRCTEPPATARALVSKKREHGRALNIRTRPPPFPRTKWTRRVLLPVLIGHAASLTPYCADDHTATPRNASSPGCDEISTCSGARARELAACGLRLGSAVLDLEVDSRVLPEVPHRAEQHASFPVRRELEPAQRSARARAFGARGARAVRARRVQSAQRGSTSRTWRQPPRGALLARAPLLRRVHLVRGEGRDVSS